MSASVRLCFRSREASGGFPARRVMVALFLVLWASGGYGADSASPGYSAGELEVASETGQKPSNWSIAEAVLRALESHAAFRVERLQPHIARTFEERERASFDPYIAASAFGERTESGDERVDVQHGAVEAGRVFPSGTRLEAGLGATRYDDSTRNENADYGGDISISLTQPLLRGRGSEVQHARLRQAEIDTLLSEKSLRWAAEELAARVEEAAWGCILAERRIAIYEESLRLARDQRSEIKERIRIGRLADIELAAAEAEVAQRREDLINARADLRRRQIAFLRLVSPPDDNWDCDPKIIDEPVVPGEAIDDVERHVQTAVELRADLAEARLRVKRGDVEIVRTRNGLLPQLDLFIALGRTGYSDSFSTAYSSPDTEEDYMEAGLRLVHTFGRRRERAEHERGILLGRQAEEALRNMRELVQVDVRMAHVEVLRTREQIAATGATRRFREESLRAETEKLRVGRSTSLLVAQAQRDLVAARISEVEAVINHLTARLRLARLDGTLLQQRGIRFD